MTIQEISAKKTEAENKIVDILNEFEKETTCKISDISLDTTEEEFGFLGQAQIIKRNVTIISFIP